MNEKPKEVNLWFYELYKGKLQSFVAREKESISKVTKTLNTALKKGQISSSDLEKMLFEVQRDTVDAFVKWANYSARKERLEEVKKGLTSLKQG